MPKRRVSNAELAAQVDTSDEWITERTGIKFRHIADDSETTATLGADAARAALTAARMDAGDIDLIIVATATPDQTFPASATKVQHLLGCNGCVAFDVAAVCSGFLYAFSVAESMIRAGSAKNALVIGSETFSRILDWEDRATCVLFGDGAGAVVLCGEIGERGVFATKLHADGKHNELLYVDGGPSTTGTVGKLRMAGPRGVPPRRNQSVERDARGARRRGHWAPSISTGLSRIRRTGGLSTRPRKSWDLPAERVMLTVDHPCQYLCRFGSLGTGRRGARRADQAGDLVVLEAMGGGFTWGASLVRM